MRVEDLDNAWELANYFVAQSYRVYAEFKKESKDDLLAFALSRFLENKGGEWEGTATELFDALTRARLRQGPAQEARRPHASGHAGRPGTALPFRPRRASAPPRRGPSS